MSLPDNHMDDLFRERLGNFSPEPPPGVWNRIQEGLAQKRGARRLIVYRWAGVAALLLMAIITGILMPFERKSTNDQADRGKMTLPHQIVTDTSHVTDLTRQFTTAEHPSPEAVPGKRTRISNQPEVFPPSREKTRDNYLPVMAATDGFVKRPEFLIPLQGEITLVLSPENELVLALSMDAVPEKTANPVFPVTNELPVNNHKAASPKEWEIGIRLTPAFDSQSAGYSDSYARNLSSSGSTGQTGMGGGVSVKFKTSRRWKVESGLYYSRNDINPDRNSQLYAANADSYSLASGSKNFYSNQVFVKNGKMAVNSPAGVIHIAQIPEKASLVAGAESAIGMDNILLTTGDFSQVFDFLELPLTARYLILDGKIGIELQSGLSANFVVGNQVFTQSGSQKEYVGKTSDIARLGFSGIAGFGISYPLSKRMAITIEPRASYWLSSLNNSGEVTFKPWKIGIYSGLTFGF